MNTHPHPLPGGTPLLNACRPRLGRALREVAIHTGIAAALLASGAALLVLSIILDAIAR